MASNKIQKGRRDFLSGLGVLGVGLASTKVFALEECVGLTPVQPEGPFYPVEDQLDKDSDLTYVSDGRFVDSQPRYAFGQKIYVRGKVLDENCAPLSGAMVEIWQACHTGKYNHASDPNPAALDPHFQYWGQAISNENGEYKFKTIVPGAYPAGDGWIRPPHIHFKVALRGYDELITQLYFAGETLNDRDLILKRLPRPERDKVIVSLQSEHNESDQKAKLAVFDIVLKKIV